MEEKKVHLVAKASFEAWRPLSGVVFREESEFEVKMAPNHKKLKIVKTFKKMNHVFFEFPKKTQNLEYYEVPLFFFHQQECEGVSQGVL